MNPTFNLFFHSAKFKLRSELSKEELLQRLASETEPTGKLGMLPYFPKTYKVFRGKIRGDTFEVIASPSRLRTLIPTYKGVIKQRYDYTSIEISMSPHRAVSAFLTCFVYMLLTLCLLISALIMQALFNDQIYHSYHPSMLFVFLLLVTLPILKVLPFKFRSDEGLIDIMALFHAKFEVV